MRHDLGQSEKHAKPGNDSHGTRVSKEYSPQHPAMFLEVSLGRRAQLLPVFANHALQRHAHVCECLQCMRVSPKLQLQAVEDACGNMRGSQIESQLITALVSKDPSSFNGGF